MMRNVRSPHGRSPGPESRDQTGGAHVYVSVEIQKVQLRRIMQSANPARPKCLTAMPPAYGYHYAFYSTLLQFPTVQGYLREGRFAAIGKSPLRADANRGCSNVGFAKRERRRVQNLILSESSRRTPRESSGAAANRLSEWGKAGAS